MPGCSNSSCTTSRRSPSPIPNLQRQVDTALARIAAYRAAARRELTLHVRGSGARNVRVGYVVAMPLWKASYRLSLPADRQRQDGPAARLGGAREFQRPGLERRVADPAVRQPGDVPSGPLRKLLRDATDGTGRIRRPMLPPPDTGTVAAAEPRGREERAASRSTDQGPPGAIDARPPAGLPAAAASAAGPDRRRDGRRGGDADRLHLAREGQRRRPGRAWCVPLLDRDLPARRIDLYQPSVDGRHPLAAVELTNDSGTGLPPGVLTLYQQGAGERRAVSRRCAARGLCRPATSGS